MRIAIIAALALFVTQASPPKATIEGRVVHPGTLEPISDVLVTLIAPVPASATSALSPDAANRLASQISDINLAATRAGLSQQALDDEIENARRNVAPGRPSTVLTDSSGRFSFRDLSPGRYSIRAERDGYFAAPRNGTAPTIVTKSITVEEGKSPPPDDILMVKGAVISGRILDPNGKLAGGISVAVYRESYSNGRKIWTMFNSKTTDDRGEYRIYWLIPGDYFVGVTPRASGTTPGPQDYWIRTLYPNVIEPADAMPLQLKDGSEASGIDIGILPAASGTFKISGVVTNPFVKANPTTGVADRSIASFVLSPRDPGVLDSVNPPSVVNALPPAARQNGEFELRNIKPGAYDLYPLPPVITDAVPASPGTAPGTAAPAGRGGDIIQVNGGVYTVISGTAGGVPVTRRQPTSRTPVEVRRDVADLRIVVGNGVPLSGEVLINGSGGNTALTIKPDSIRLTLRNFDTMPPSFASLVGVIAVDTAGKFTVPNVPEARYMLQVAGLPAAAYVADIRQAGVSVMDNGFFLDQGASSIQIVIEPGGATVQGMVRNSEGKPAANATVVLVPPAPRRQNALLYRVAITNESGSFSLKGVPPGPFTIFAWDSVPQTAWQNTEFLSHYESRGRAIDVRALAVSEVELNLIPAD